MFISQSWKETGNRKQEAGEIYFLSPVSCLLSVITALHSREIRAMTINNLRMGNVCWTFVVR